MRNLGLLAMLLGPAAMLGCEAASGDAPRADAASAPGARDAGDADASELPKEDSFPCLGPAGTRVMVSGSALGPEPLCTNLSGEARCRATQSQAEADRACETDNDCVEVDHAPSCIFNQGVAFASKAGAKTIADAVAEIDRTVCARFDDMRCIKQIGSGVLTAPREPACLEGECRPLMGCALGTRRSNRLLEAQRPALAAGCTTDEDCSVELPPACAWSCADAPTFVAKVNAQRYDQLLRSLEDTCQRATLGEQCNSLPCNLLIEAEATCQAGTCVAR